MSSICLTEIPAACKAVIADSRPEPGPLTPLNFDFLHAVLDGLFSCLLCSGLTGKRRALSRTLEAACTSTCPAKRVTLGVGDRYCRVIERRFDAEIPAVTLRRILRRLESPDFEPDDLATTNPSNCYFLCIQ